MSVSAPQIHAARPSEEMPLPEFEVSPSLSRLGALAVVVVFGLSGLAWTAIVWAIVALLG